jgi:hypothetical protein
MADLVPQWDVPFVDENRIMRQEWRWFMISLIAAVNQASQAASTIGGVDEMAPNVDGLLLPDIAVGLTHSVTLVANGSLGLPANMAAGTLLLLRIVQDAAGGHAMTFDPFYRGLSLFALDTTPNTAAGMLFQVSQDKTGADLLLIAMNGSPIA